MLRIFLGPAAPGGQSRRAIPDAPNLSDWHSLVAPAPQGVAKACQGVPKSFQGIPKASQGAPKASQVVAQGLPEGSSKQFFRGIRNFLKIWKKTYVFLWFC